MARCYMADPYHVTRDLARGRRYDAVGKHRLLVGKIQFDISRLASNPVTATSTDGLAGCSRARLRRKLPLDVRLGASASPIVRHGT
jgi:hypothetical protein